MEILGIDIGGTGIKGTLVDTITGEILKDKYRVDTPKPATVEAVVAAIEELIKAYDWKGPIGCGFPGVVRDNQVFTAHNLDKGWIGADLGREIERLTGKVAVCLNDADAAGLCEMHLGAGRGKHGVVMMLTLGTGIGSAMFVDGKLVPNTELGHLKKDGVSYEKFVSAVSRERRELSWEDWAKEFNEYLNYLYDLFTPTTFILGGGGAKRPEKFMEYLNVPAEVVIAEYKNKAGILGAALAARIKVEVE